jgi:hypothetical protein
MSSYSSLPCREKKENAVLFKSPEDCTDGESERNSRRECASMGEHAELMNNLPGGVVNPGGGAQHKKG